MPINFKAIEVHRERTMIPTPREFEVGPNPSYLNSLVTGCFSPILHLPQIIVLGALWPFIKSIANAMAFICLSFYAGITGRANGFRIIGMKERELTNDEKELALRDMMAGSGYKAIPLDTSLANKQDQ